MNATLEHGTATPETTTRQTVELDSKDGKKILRQIVKDSEDWRGLANDSTGWNLELTRTIRGAIGEPDITVRIQTDLNLKPHGNLEYTNTHNGETYRVTVPACRRIWLDAFYLSTACQLLLDGWQIDAKYSHGSLNTDRHGISYHILSAYKRPNYYRNVTISQTVFINGRQMTSGGMES